MIDIQMHELMSAGLMTQHYAVYRYNINWYVCKVKKYLMFIYFFSFRLS